MARAPERSDPALEANKCLVESTGEDEGIALATIADRIPEQIVEPTERLARGVDAAERFIGPPQVYQGVGRIDIAAGHVARQPELVVQTPRLSVHPQRLLVASEVIQRVGEVHQTYRQIVSNARLLAEAARPFVRPKRLFET